MSLSIIIGLTGLFGLLLAIAAGIPIAVALGAVSLLGLGLLIGAPVALSAARDTPFDLVASWSLSAIPMFLLMGAFAQRSGISASLFTAARVWLARLPGGLLIATNLASAVFAAASGSSMATAAAMARFALPEMRRAGYDPAFAAATVASAGTVGALIPPSILFILYGIVAQTSIAKLFVAGILPGLLTIGTYIVAISVYCRVRPSIAPRGAAALEGLLQQRWKARLHAAGGAWPGLMLVGVVIVGIYTGVFTPVEAGAAGAAAALAIALVRKTLSLDSFWQSLREACVVSAQIFFIAVGATLFKQFLLLSGLTTLATGAWRGY